MINIFWSKQLIDELKSDQTDELIIKKLVAALIFHVHCTDNKPHCFSNFSSMWHNLLQEFRKQPEDIQTPGSS